jgi:hypothetical protein
MRQRHTGCQRHRDRRRPPLTPQSGNTPAAFLSRRGGGEADGCARSRRCTAPRITRYTSRRSRKLAGCPAHERGPRCHPTRPCHRDHAPLLPRRAPLRPLHEACAPARFDGWSLPPCARGVTWWATKGSSGRGPLPQMAQTVALSAIARSIFWDARALSRGGMACWSQREPWHGRPHWRQARMTGLMLGALVRW